MEHLMCGKSTHSREVEFREQRTNKGDIVIEMLARQARIVLDAAEGGDA